MTATLPPSTDHGVGGDQPPPHRPHGLPKWAKYGALPALTVALVILGVVAGVNIGKNSQIAEQAPPATSTATPAPIAVATVPATPAPAQATLIAPEPSVAIAPADEASGVPPDAAPIPPEFCLTEYIARGGQPKYLTAMSTTSDWVNWVNHFAANIPASEPGSPGSIGYVHDTAVASCVIASPADPLYPWVEQAPGKGGALFTNVHTVKMDVQTYDTAETTGDTVRYWKGSLIREATLDPETHYDTTPTVVRLELKTIGEMTTILATTCPADNPRC